MTRVTADQTWGLACSSSEAGGSVSLLSYPGPFTLTSQIFPKKLTLGMYFNWLCHLLVSLGHRSAKLTTWVSAAPSHQTFSKSHSVLLKPSYFVKSWFWISQPWLTKLKLLVLFPSSPGPNSLTTYSILPKKSTRTPQTPSFVHPCYMFRWTLSCPATPKPLDILSDSECTYFQTETEQGTSRGHFCVWRDPCLDDYCGLQAARCKHSADILTAVPQVSEGRDESPDDRLSPTQWVSRHECQWGGALREPQPAFHLPASSYPTVFYLGNPILPKVQTRRLITCR